MDLLRDLLFRLQYSPWLDWLPPGLRQPPALWLVLTGAAVLAILALVWLFRVLSRRLGGPSTRPGGEARRAVARELAERRRQGDELGVGELYEDQGQHRKALAAYRRGGHHEARAALLAKIGKRRQAREAAREGRVWRLYAELCQEDGDLDEAAVAFERDGQAYLAARCYGEVGRRVDAARGYLAAGMEAQAVEQLALALGGAEGGAPDGPDAEREIAELLDQALRSSIAATGAEGLSLELSKAVARGVQLWLAVDDPRRAFDLAVAAEKLALAVPVAKDFLPPEEATAEVCERAGAPLVAAELYRRLGRGQRADRLLAEHHLDRGDRRRAAEHFEAAEDFIDAAEQRAALGEDGRAAELFRRGGDLQSAAQLYARGGETWRSQELLSEAYALSVDGHFETDETARVAPPPAGSPPTATAPPVSPVGETVPQVPGRQNPGVPRPRSPHPGTRAPKNPPPDPSRLDGPGPSFSPPPAGSPEGADAGAETRPAGADGSARYRLLDELGRGGMGVVYRAEDRVLQREVAYKVLPEGLVSRDITPESLLAEARAAARLSHLNIVQVYDAGRHGEGFFFVMELVRGQTLEAMLERRRMTVRGAIQVGRQILAALTHAHERHLIHRDLKPSNLLWSEDKRIKLSDFGLARAFEATVGNVRTQPAGTPSYMSPEQIRGEPLGPQTDLYAFGCVMWEMLCRRPVFGTGAPSFHHHLTSPPGDPRQVRPEIPAPLAELILECLAKDPARRPRTASQIADRLAAMMAKGH